MKKKGQLKCGLYHVAPTEHWIFYYNLDLVLIRILLTEPIPIRAAHQTSDDWSNAGPAWEAVRS